jgi:hypothetical protein
MIEFVSALPMVTATNGGNVTLTFSNLRDVNNLPQLNTALQTDDLIIVAAAHSHPTTGQTIGTSSSGWSVDSQDEQLGGTARARAAILTKFVGGTVDTNIVITGGGGNTSTGVVACAMVFRGVDPSKYDVSTVIVKGTGSAKPNPGSVTPLSDGAFIVVVGVGVLAAGFLFTQPGDLATGTFKWKSANVAETMDTALGIGIKEDWVSGAFDPAAWTNASVDTANAAWIAFTIVLKPKPGPLPTKWEGVSGPKKTQYFTNSIDGFSLTMNNSPGGSSGTRTINGRDDKRRFEISYDTAAATNTNGSMTIGVIDGTAVLGPTGSDTPGGSGGPGGCCWRLQNASASAATFRLGAQGASQTLPAVLTIGDRLAIEYDPGNWSAELFHRPVGTGVWSSVGTLPSNVPDANWWPWIGMFYTGSVITGYFTSASQNGTPSAGYVAYDDVVVNAKYLGVGNRASRYLGNQAAPLPYIGPGTLFAS